MTPFVLRPIAGRDDEDFVIPSWINSFARSTYGVQRGAHIPQAVPGYSKRPSEAAWNEFWSEQQPIVEHLVRTTDVVLACDAQSPETIWGWACTSGDTVHNVLVKRSVHRVSAEYDEARHMWRVTTGLSGDIYRALLGERLRRACGYTFELVDIRRRELMVQGVSLPTKWFCDSTWFARQRRAA